jgi:hypothetical protein
MLALRLDISDRNFRAYHTIVLRDLIVCTIVYTYQNSHVFHTQLSIQPPRMPPSIILDSLRSHHSSLQKRSADCDTYYTSSCSTHRTVLLIIIILVGAFVGIIFSLVYVRSRSRRLARIQANRMNANVWRQRYLGENLRTSDGTATVRLPSGRVVGVDGGQRWRKGESWDEGRDGREAPPPAYALPPPYMPRVPEAVRASR